MTTMFPGGTEVEVGMFGYESVIGVSALMGTVQSLNHVYTQVAGTGYRCSYANALKEFSRFGVFHESVPAVRPGSVSPVLSVCRVRFRS